MTKPRELQKGIRDTGKEYDPQEEAEKALYRDKEGKIYFPSKWLKGCIENAAKGVKKGSGRLILRLILMRRLLARMISKNF